MESIEKYLESKAEKVHRFLEREVESWTDVPLPPGSDGLFPAGGGKRLRPILVLATAEALGGPRRRRFPLPARSK